MKDERYGLGLDLALSRTKARYTVRLLVAALAVFITWLFGKVAHQRKLHMRYQANTIAHRQVLSFVYLGVRIARKSPISISREELAIVRRDLHVACAF